MIGFRQAFGQEPLGRFLDAIDDTLHHLEGSHQHGRQIEWEQTVAQITSYESNGHLVDQDRVTILSKGRTPGALKTQLLSLRPWRKGPFSILGVDIDTEWRSDWKWHRIADAAHWENASVLDVGCGSGYHLWRMWGAGARLVLGIDPTRLYRQQFNVLKGFMPQAPAHFLPFRLEDFPKNTQSFDIVTSMGVLYHCKSPFQHLEELKGALKKGGTLILETLIVEGPIHTVLVPTDRYAQMRNVWCIPSPETLCMWLERAGFIGAKIHDITPTTLKEQQTTEWMPFHSLADFLDSDDPTKTIEGYPAPVRVVITAQRPQ